MGIVENMSYFSCPKCGHESHIFGKQGAKETAEKMNVPFLGGIPLDIEIRATSDAGKPIAASLPNSPQTSCYVNIAKKVIVALESKGASDPEPNIVIE